MLLNDLVQTLLATSNPALPSLAATNIYLRAAWALLLVTGAMWLLRRQSHKVLMLCTAALVAWVALPGALSPAYWLGLAFQAPSLMASLLCLAALVAHWRHPAAPCMQARFAEHAAAFSAMALGWVLLFDLIAWLPVSVYAWGFSAAAVAVAALIALLPWVLGRGSARLSLPLLAVLLFVLTRLPTGNLWDALLDPWLWFALHLGYLVKAKVLLRGPK